MKKLIITNIILISFSIAIAQPTNKNIRVIKPTSFNISRPLSELFDQNSNSDQVIDPTKESDSRQNRKAQTFLHKAEDGPEYGNNPNTIQHVNGIRQTSAILTSWAGQTGVGCPPDPTGAAGINHYVQAVNSTPFKVFNKTTGATVGSVQNIGELWTPAVDDLGDPIVMYDKYADRWFISQFGGDFFSNNYAYIAISTSGDPTGTYYTYTFSISEFPDYLKFSIWSDGYYMTFNGSNEIYCFERDQMLVGNPSARAISATFSAGNTGSFFLSLPGDADGGLAPFGTPLPFFSYSDNAWGGGSVDGIKIWTMAVDWSGSPSATIAGPTTVPTAAFDASYDPNWDDIEQATGSQKLDGIGGVLMYRAQWRKWTGYNSVVLNWGVKLSETQRSIKWAELRQDQNTGTWSLYQEGTYAPDALNRWVGSIAMDDNGAIALCYAVAGPSPATSPSLRYTGRLQGDPLGQMTFTETTAIAGSGSVTSCGNRFGDYSQTAIDPDGITFWHTGEYVANGSPRTRIYSFQLSPNSGINENTHQPKVLVHQVNKMLNIKATDISSNKDFLVDLFDISGKHITGAKIMSVSNTLETSIDASELSSGVYLIRVGNTEFQKVVKVVVN